MPVSNSDLRLETMRGQPPDTASMNLEFSFSIEWLMVSLTASPCMAEEYDAKSKALTRA